MTPLPSPVNRDRLFAEVMALAEITDPDHPYTRRSFSPRFLQGREWLRAKFESLGLTVRLDAAANMIGRREGAVAGAPAIVLGSHSDTVPSGGRFDGIAGILAAVEAVRALLATGYQPRRPIEIVDFLAEEPSEYGVSCVGSRAMAGKLDGGLLGYVNAAGETLSAAIARMGGDPARIGSAKRDDIQSYLELHIEQGVALENGGIDLGLVTSIVGIARVEIAFVGSADHSGTTPMALRRDASLAAAELMLFIAREARALAARDGYFVGTVGVLEISPNAANVVPGGARMVVELRSETQGPIDAFIARLDAESAEIAERARVARSRFAVLSKTAPTRCDPGLREALGRGAAKLGLTTMAIPSGAGHDAGYLSHIAPSAMLFIPCLAGKSHAPEEWAEPEALAAGAATLMEAILLLDEAEPGTS
jgi:N-carbamoyl-L-amino-acid hydrolase